MRLQTLLRRTFCWYPVKQTKQICLPAFFQKSLCSSVKKALIDGHQHDASEFLLQFLDALHEETDKVVDRKTVSQDYKSIQKIKQHALDYTKKKVLFSNSIIDSTFNVVTVAEICCEKCAHSSVTFEENRIIIVEIPSDASTTLENCMKTHFSSTFLGESWKCPQCKENTPSNRNVFLWETPPIIIVQLKRFSSTAEGELEKNKNRVKFSADPINLEEFFHSDADKKHSEYRLFGVINHSGNLDEGHYTALVRNAKSGKWTIYDDSSVVEVDPKAIRESHKSAYILLYEKMPN